MFRNLICFLAAFCCLVFLNQHVNGDVLLPGHKNVKHELVFEDSELLQQHKLIAAPIAGFSGVVEIKAGVPFRFSSKYGTRFYIVPNDFNDLDDFEKEKFSQWPNCKPPKSEIKSVPVSNPVASAVTTIRFASLDSDGSPVVEIVRHVELDRNGNVPSPTKSILMFGLLIAAGLAFCLIAIRKMKAADKAARKADLYSVGHPDAANPDGIDPPV